MPQSMKAGTPIQWLIATILPLASAATLAAAATPGPVCDQYAKAWAVVSSGSDAARLRAAIGSIPADCAVKTRAEQRLASVVRQEQQLAAEVVARQQAAQAQFAQAESAREKTEAATAAAQAAAAEVTRQAADAETARAHIVADDADYSSAKAANTFAALDDYVQRYPVGRHLGEAQAAIGEFYISESGGVARDSAEAARWHLLAAANGVAEAQWRAGDAYKYGDGVQKNYIEAVRWFRLSAAQGYQLAQMSMAEMYSAGDGVGRDYVEAARWYRLTAAQGGDTGALAASDLAQLYVEGHLEGPPDPETLRVISEIASEDGGGEYKDWLAQHPH